jgi:hypothetical protein
MSAIGGWGDGTGSGGGGWRGGEGNPSGCGASECGEQKVPLEESGGPSAGQQHDCGRWDLGDAGGVARRHGNNDEGQARTSCACPCCGSGEDH